MLKVYEKSEKVHPKIDRRETCIIIRARNEYGYNEGWHRRRKKLPFVEMNKA